MKSFAHGRRVPGTMNGTEAKYAEHLELMRRAGEVEWFQFEGVTFKLANDTRYTPDFLVMLKDGELQAHEVKGFFRDDAKVKVKVASAMFPLKFVVVKALPKKLGGGWSREEF